MHVLDSDEIFHFYLGDPVEMLQLYPDGRSRFSFWGRICGLGSRSNWSCGRGVAGTRLIGDGTAALLGCTVTPGFDFADYRGGSYAELAEEWPAEAERIRALTRS